MMASQNLHLFARKGASQVAMETTKNSPNCDISGFLSANFVDEGYLSKESFNGMLDLFLENENFATTNFVRGTALSI